MSSNKLLHKLAKESTFRRLWDIPIDDLEAEKNGAYAQMADLELVLRFLAVLHPEAIDLRFKDYLSAFMESRNKAYKTEPALEQQDAKSFATATANVWTVFGERAFRKPDTDRNLTQAKSAPLADAEMTSLADIPQDKVTEPIARAIEKGFIELCLDNPAFQKSITSGTNGKGAISTRVGLAKEMVSKILGNP